MQLSRKEKNGLAEIVKNCGYDLSEFDLTEREKPNGQHIYKWVLKKHGYNFEITVKSDGYYINLFPYGFSYLTDQYHGNFHPDIENAFRRWLNQVKEELNTEDLWEKAKKYPQGTDIKIEIVFDDSPFTQSEIKLLKENISKLKERIATVEGILPGQLKKIKERIDTLVQIAEETKQLTKRKWYETFSDSVFACLIQMAIEKIPFNKIWGYISNTAQHLLK